MVLPPQTEGIAAKSVRWVSRARIFWEDGPPRTLSVNSWEAGGLQYVEKMTKKYDFGSSKL